MGVEGGGLLEYIAVTIEEIRTNMSAEEKIPLGGIFKIGWARQESLLASPEGKPAARRSWSV